MLKMRVDAAMHQRCCATHLEKNRPADRHSLTPREIQQLQQVKSLVAFPAARAGATTEWRRCELQTREVRTVIENRDTAEPGGRVIAAAGVWEPLPDHKIHTKADYVERWTQTELDCPSVYVQTMTIPHLVVGTQTTLAGTHVADDALLSSLLRTFESTLAKIERHVNVGSSHNATVSVAQARSDIDLLLSRHGWMKGVWHLRTSAEEPFYASRIMAGTWRNIDPAHMSKPQFRKHVVHQATMRSQDAIVQIIRQQSSLLDRLVKEVRELKDSHRRLEGIPREIQQLHQVKSLVAFPAARAGATTEWRRCELQTREVQTVIENRDTAEPGGRVIAAAGVWEPLPDHKIHTKANYVERWTQTELDCPSVYVQTVTIPHLVVGT